MAGIPAVIVDSHHHFWSAHPEYGTADYLPDDYLADAAPLAHRLRASLFAECNTHYDRGLPTDLQSIGETRFAAALGERFARRPTRCVAAIIAHADPFANEIPFDQIIDAHLEAGSGRLRAIRRSTAWDEDARFNYPILKTQPHMLLDVRFTRALHVLADRDLVFDAWVYHPQLTELAALARAARQCTIILDHAGTPLGSGRHGDWKRSWKLWKAGMQRLADEPNVHAKLGGLITANSPLDSIRQQGELDSWTAPALAEELAPWLDHVIRCFRGRSMPLREQFPCRQDVLRPRGSHRGLYKCTNASDGAGSGGNLSRNAARIYRIELEGGSHG